MPPIIATFLFTIGILGLFYLDRHQDSRVSKALWIPALWLFINCSRPVSMWLGVSGASGGGDATDIYVEGNPVNRNVYTMLMLLALVVLFTRAHKIEPTLRKNLLLIAYLLFCLFSLIWSDFPLVAFKRWNKEAFGDIPMVLIILTEALPLTALKRLMTKLGFLLIPLSVLFIRYYPRLGRRLTNSWTMEPVGVTAQKNSLGLLCLIWGVFFLWMFISVYRDRNDPNRRGRLLAYGTIMGMIVYLLSACNSTTSIVGMICASAVVWFAGRPGRRPALVHLLVLAVLGGATFALFFDPGGGMVEAIGKDPTLTGRKHIWDLVLSLHTNPWIGTGFESFWLGERLDFMRNSFQNLPINEAHNGYLELYLNLGWTGICFLTALLLTAYLRVTSRSRQDPFTASLFLGFLLCTLFNAFTENAFRILTPSWIFFILVVVACSQPELFSQPRSVSLTPVTPAELVTEGGELPIAESSRLSSRIVEKSVSQEL